jgi:hypothetical protein
VTWRRLCTTSPTVKGTHGMLLESVRERIANPG